MPPSPPNKTPDSASTQAGRSRRQVHNATVSPSPLASDKYTRSAATELVSAVTGATSNGTPRARAGSNQAAGTCPLTWLT